MDTERVPGSQLLKEVEEKMKIGFVCCHPFDDLDLIAGHSSIAFEIMDELDPDIVLCGCGGGGLLAAVSYGLKLLGSKAIVYGVEPESANTMFQSFEKGEPVTYTNSKSVAAGLGKNLNYYLF